VADSRINAKQDWVESRVGVVTVMSHGQIVASEQFKSSVRTHCFFSARVAQTRVLDRLRKVSDEYTLGQTDKASARAQLKDFLRTQGYLPDGAITDDDDTDHSVSNLASTARLNLILDQNKLMADAIGKRSEILRLGVPYQQYVPSWKQNRRDSHKRYYNIVLPATDPFWAEHTPPLEFQCGCTIAPVWDAEDAEEFGGVATAVQDPDGNWTVTAPDGSKIPVPPSESGYQFDSSAAFQVNDLGRLHEPYRERLVQDMERLIQNTNSPMMFVASEPEAGAAGVALPGANGLDQAMRKGTDDVRQLATRAGFDPDNMPPSGQFEAVNQGWEAAGLSSRNPPPSLLDSVPDSGRVLGAIDAANLRRLGLPGESLDIVLGRGSRRIGIKHCYFHHKEVFVDAAETMALVTEAFGDGQSLLTMGMIPGRGGAVTRRIGGYNRRTRAMCVLEIRGGQAEMLSWHRADDDYTDQQVCLRAVTAPAEDEEA
jgi:hypothetical protein